MKLEVNEIFNSFQGEGIYTGYPATFLRLSKCNLNCDFCDTDFNKSTDLSIPFLKNILIENMEKHHNDLLVITGGEPLLQYDALKELIKELEYHQPIQIETNGSIMKKPLKATYVISPKKNIQEIFKYYKDYNNVYFKFLITDGFRLHQIKQLIYKYNYTQPIYLQPEYSNAQQITELILSKNLKINYRISGQLHKYLGVQ